jgi:hypothetical protein
LEVTTHYATHSVISNLATNFLPHPKFIIGQDKPKQSINEEKRKREAKRFKIPDTNGIDGKGI